MDPQAWTAIDILLDEVREAPCKVCGKPAIWIECPTGSWWAHVDHPADEHDAEIEEAE